MKNTIATIFSLIAVTISAYAQELKLVKVDDLVSVKLPENYQLKDTLGQKILSGNGDLGYMVVIKANNPKTKPLQKEKDLKKVFKEYISKVQGQSNGSVLNQRDTTIGNLKATVFGLETNDANGAQIRDFAVIYTQEATYTFEYLYPTSRKDLIKDEHKAFFSSINASPELQRTDQYVNTASSSSPVGKIAIWGGGAIVLIMIGYFVFRKKTETAMS
ncbi:MAG: hypothetical protein EOP46_12855 [Sphingobacteriaceae bacterium]|nr:MAG: hypothetical protein EOP46_12855 [Sphingobacteriaceae bacterium]